MVEHVAIVTEGEDYDSVNRNAVMDLVIEGLDKNLVRGWLDRDSTGPRGGTSSRLYCVVEVNGIMVPAAINIYSDAAIESQVKKKIGEDKRSDRIRNALESVNKELEIPIADRSGFTREQLETFNMDSLRLMLEKAGVDSGSVNYKSDLVNLAYEHDLGFSAAV